MDPVYGKVLLKWMVKKCGKRMRIGFALSGQGSVVGCCECGSEILGS